MSWENDKILITERHFEAINLINLSLFGSIKQVSPTDIQPIYPFVSFIISRLNAVSTLATQDLLWDAEIILRSALETFIKFLFITSASEEERKTRLGEFWNDLEEINKLKQSEQAKKNLKVNGDNEAIRLANSPNVLSPEKEEELRNKWPRKKRQNLEQKWSFSEIISSIAKNYRGKPAERFLGLAHTYRMASHVTHGDETGILIISERESRSDSDREIVNAAHYVRLMSDCLAFTYWTALEVIKFINKDSKEIVAIYKSMEDISNLTEIYTMKLYDDPDYEKYKTK